MIQAQLKAKTSSMGKKTNSASVSTDLDHKTFSFVYIIVCSPVLGIC